MATTKLSGQKPVVIKDNNKTEYEKKLKAYLSKQYQSNERHTNK